MTFENVSGEPRRAAYDILQRVEEGGYADLLLGNYLSRHREIDPRDKGLLTELVYGVLRLQGRLDFALGQCCRQPLQRLEPPARRLLRLGAYQLLELDRVPDHAAVDTSVELARDLGFERLVGLINGVLRNLQRQREAIPWPTPESPKPYLQHVCSLPTWLAKELLRQLPNVESTALGEALCLPAPQTLRVNMLKGSREQLMQRFAEASLEAIPCGYAPEGLVLERSGEIAQLPRYGEGAFMVQDQASMLVAHLLGAQPDERVLDACAAPGGKTTHLAALMDNRGEIVALDKYPQRVALIDANARRLGCSIVTTQCGDLLENDVLADEIFDRVLLDAPCSGLGVVRRNPESRWQKSPATVRELAAVQLKLLERSAAAVRPGGTLLYSVCTFTHAETDATVDVFLEMFKSFELVDLCQVVSEAWLPLLDRRGCLRTYPHRHEGMDAFFAARFRRKENPDDV